MCLSKKNFPLYNVVFYEFNTPLLLFRSKFFKKNFLFRLECLLTQPRMAIVNSACVIFNKKQITLNNYLFLQNIIKYFLNLSWIFIKKLLEQKLIRNWMNHKLSRVIEINVECLFAKQLNWNRIFAKINIIEHLTLQIRTLLVKYLTCFENGSFSRSVVKTKNTKPYDSKLKKMFVNLRLKYWDKVMTSKVLKDKNLRTIVI